MRTVWFLISIGFLLLTWELSSRLLPSLHFVMPAPSEIVAEIGSRPGRFAHHSWCTVREILGALALGVTAAFPLAWLMLAWKGARVTVQPLMVLLQAVPMFALAPIMVLWFGWSYFAIVVPTALMVLFPVTVSIYQGLRSTPAALIDLFRSYGAPSWRIFFQAQLPWSLPHILSGLRIAGGIAALGAVAGEWAGAQEGLGIFMLESRRSADLVSTFGALFCLVAISLTLYGLIAAVHRWRRVMPLLTCLALLMTGCSSQHDRPLKLLLDWFPNPNHIPLYVAIERGFFAEEGLQVELLKLRDPADTIPYLTSRQCDLAIYYMPYTLKAMSHGAKVRVAGFLFQETLESVIVRADRETKRIGYSLAGIHRSAVLEKLHSIESVNVSYDVIGSLAAGHVDATTGGYWNIEGAQLTSMGIPWMRLTLDQFGVPPYDELVVLARPEFDRCDPFKQALQKAIDWSVSHPDEAFAIYAQANPDKSFKTLAWERQAWLLTYPHLTQSQQLDRAKWQRYAEWLQERKLVQGPISLDQL
jgi:NitT/TauT family transport system substrate-binding protein